MAFDINSLFANTKGLSNDIAGLYNLFGGQTGIFDKLLSGSIGNLGTSISGLNKDASGLLAANNDLTSAANLDQSLFSQIQKLANTGPDFGPANKLLSGSLKPTLGLGPNGSFLDPAQTRNSMATAGLGERGDIASQNLNDRLSFGSMLPGIASSEANILNEQGSLNNQVGGVQNQIGSLENTQGGLFNQLMNLNNNFGGLGVSLGGAQNQVGSMNNYIRELDNLASQGQSGGAGGGLFKSLLGL